MGSLSGLHVLVTRPAHQAAGLVLKLEDAGASVESLPLLAIAGPHDPALARQTLLDHVDADLWIFTSANAVRGAARLQGHNWPPALLALGQASVRALAELGHAATAPEGGSSEDLLLWPELAELAGRRVLIISGEGGRTLLAETLRGRGAQVAVARCYRREPIQYPAPQLGAALHRADVVVLTSGEALQALLAQAPRPIQPALLLPSERVAALARAAGVNSAMLLPAAVSDAAMVLRLEQWRHDRQNAHHE